MISKQVARGATTVASTVVLTGVLLGGCGSSGGSASTDDGATPSASSAAPTTAAPASGSPSTAAPSTGGASAAAGDVPDAATLGTTIDTLIDRSKPVADRTAKVVGGNDLGPTLTKLDAYLKDFTVTFKVSKQTLQGDTVKGSVQIFSGGRPFPDLYPGFWQQLDGKWELTRSGACSLIAVSGITCPDAAVS